MLPKTNSISGDEMYLRLHSPQFLKELIKSRTDSLVAAGDIEGLAAWNQERAQKDRLWEELLSAAPNLKLQVVEQEKFHDALKGFASEFAKIAPEHINPRVFEASVEDILREELAEEVPVDRQMEVNKEIDTYNAKQFDERNLVNKSFGQEPRAEAQEFLASQRRVGNAALELRNSNDHENAQTTDEKIVKSPSPKIEPPEQD